ncbi:20 kDa chaperonin, chloroplastic-like protein [Tanacetum coccineum]
MEQESPFEYFIVAFLSQLHGDLKMGKNKGTAYLFTNLQQQYVGISYITLKPLGDRVLVKINAAEDKITGGILLPTTVKTSMGEVVAVGEGMTSWSEAGGSRCEVVYSKYVRTEVEFNGAKHLLLKRDDIVGILETDHVKDLKPLNERVLIKWEPTPIRLQEDTTMGRLELETSRMGKSPLTNSARQTLAGGLLLTCGP